MNEFFAAANSAMGFASWFDDIFPPKELDRTYIIKGGSGTGKSTLMKKVAAKWCERGGSCEYFYCSSDVTSLDGILLYSDSCTIGMIDGTAPHMRDPRYPGAAEELINLGNFWDTDKLIGKREDIIKLTERKSRLFEGAYRDLFVVGQTMRLRLEQIEKCLQRKKLEAAVMRLLTKRIKSARIKPSAAPRRRIRALSAISTQGMFSFVSVPSDYEICLAVDVMGSAPFLFSTLRSCADKLGLDYDYSPCALLPELCEAIFFPTLKLGVVTKCDREGFKPINMARFIDRESLPYFDRARMRSLKRIESEMLNSALEKLADVRFAHASLESIYIAAMDFRRLDAAMDDVISDILSFI